MNPLTLTLAAALFLFLAACASVPADDLQAQVTQRAQALTERFNAWAGTNYPCPGIAWIDGPCGPHDLEGRAESLQYSYSPGPARNVVGMRFVNQIYLTTACALTDPLTLLDNTLPHELAHVFANHYYGVDVGHDWRWQGIAVKLGVPRSDPYITDPTLKAGGS